MAVKNAPKFAPPAVLPCVNKMKKIRNDIILVFSLIAVSLIVMLFFLLTREDGATVRIEQGGEVFGEYSINTNKEIKLDGAVLVIENGHAHIRSATCSDKLCEKQGKIAKAGETIVCLPNKIVVTVNKE